jgi:23S rRNA (guanosine2251-2'-O)-methyltransferase
MKIECSVVFGVNTVAEILRASPDQVAEIVFENGPQRPALCSIESEARRLGVKVAYAARNVLNRMAANDKHQGVVARVAPYAYSPFSDLFLNDASGGSTEWILILDGLTDPRNFGALLRTAEAVGIRRVLIPKDRSVDVTATVAKVSAGAVHHLKIFRVPNLRRAMMTIKEHGYWLVGLDGDAPERIYDRVYPNRLGIVLGNEGRGIRPLILRECDYRVSIPMIGKVASLNVAVAGAVFLYEILRQKRCVDKAGLKR